MRKFDYTKEYLEDLYINQNLTLSQIGDLIDVNYAFLSSKFKQLGVAKKSKEMILATSKATTLKKYGVDNVSKAQEIKQKKINTSLSHYGTNSPLQNKEIKEKIRNTNLLRYNVEYPSQNKDIVAKRPKKEKVQKPKIKVLPKEEKLGLGVYHTRTHLPKYVWDILDSKDLFIKYITDNKLTTAKNIADSLGVCETKIQRTINKYNIRDELIKTISSFEVDIRNHFKLYNISFRKDRAILYPQEIDLYNDNFKIGIEFNGLYWHSTKVKSNKNYHQLKSLTAEKKGVFIYHIFEHEWITKKNLILAQLNNLFQLNKNKVYARNCTIKIVSRQEKIKFLNENHFQGNSASQINLGLYCNDELVSVMTFGKPRFIKGYEYELLRFCNKKDFNIVGGASKLFKYFIETYNPISILSYSNIAKTKGKLYQTLGFTLKSISSPSYWWINHKYEVKSRYQCQMKDETKVMQAKNYFKVYDCGNKVWEWFKED